MLRFADHAKNFVPQPYTPNHNVYQGQHCLAQKIASIERFVLAIQENALEIATTVKDCIIELTAKITTHFSLANYSL